MKQEQPKHQSKPLQLTPEELEKVLKRKRRDEEAKVPPEDYLVAEMGYYYGWGGVEAMLYNQLTLDDALKLIRAARKVWKGNLLDLANVMYTTNAAAQNGKQAKKILQKGLKEVIKEARVAT